MCGWTSRLWFRISRTTYFEICGEQKYINARLPPKLRKTMAASPGCPAAHLLAALDKLYGHPLTSHQVLRQLHKAVRSRRQVPKLSIAGEMGQQPTFFGQCPAPGQTFQHVGNTSSTLPPFGIADGLPTVHWLLQRLCHSQRTRWPLLRTV